MNLITGLVNFSNRVYKPSDVFEIYARLKNSLHTVKKRVRTNDGKWGIIELYNIPVSFDTENSSFFQLIGNEEIKVAITYVWSFCINGLTVLGRTWQEYIFFIKNLAQLLELNIKKRLVVYVHNLGYDFQFMRKWFKWYSVFAIKERTPIYAIDTSGVEYRCSYLLSGYSLEKIGKDLNRKDLKKLVGFLDYNKIRHTKTPLTENEILYCVNDVRVLVAYIESKINTDGGINKIPYTKTGYVRRFCRNYCYSGDRKEKLNFREYMAEMSIDEPEEYRQLKRAFQGGFTHANPFKAGEVWENVASFDFTSSYPAVMVAEKFPCSKSQKIEKVFTQETAEDFEKYLKSYCCLFDIEFINIRPIFWFENYISESRCWKLETPVVNNGRVVSASILRTTITEQDYMIIKNLYKWDGFTVANMRIYYKAYLPTKFIRAILDLYRQKTTLKGVDGKEVEYLKSKEMLNSCYGMAVTDIVRGEIKYSDIWETVEPDIKKALEAYNKENGRFLFYPWGVWVTAYARRNLFSGILEAREDYIYSDTDSIKILNRDRHIKYISEYNALITQQLKTALKYHGIDIAEIEPKTIKGDKKPLGVWDYEGEYKKFKTLGAKRYITQNKEGRNSLTVAGLNKSAAIPYLEQKYDDIFKAFSNELEIPEGKTGKLTHTYIDEIREGEVTDYTGIKAPFKELSAVHLSPAGYSLKMSEKYIRYLQDITFISGGE